MPLNGVVLFVHFLHIVLRTGMDSGDNTGYYPAEETGTTAFS